MRLLLLLFVFVASCSGKTIARVGSRAISADEFEAYLRFKGLQKVDGPRREQLLAQYLEREALAQAVEKSKLLDEAAVKAELDEMRKELLISRYFERKLREDVSDEAVKKAYASNAGAYQEKRVRVAHVLVRAHPGLGETERQAKQTRAREAHSKVQAGMDFAKVVEAYSEDTVSVPKGGDLGWLKEGAIDPELSKVMFAMKEGEVSEPVQSAFGFHVLKILEGPTVVTRPLEEVSGEIRYRLRNELKDSETKRLMSSVKISKSNG